jgi:hypothetical protein
LLSLLSLICSSATFWTLVQAGSSRICTPSTLDVLYYFALDILDLWLYLLDVLLDLTPERLVTLGMFCSLSSCGWKLSSHLSTHSGCGKVHEACLPPMGRNISPFLVRHHFCLGTPCFRRLPRSFFCILRLLSCVLCGYPRCETCAFACLLCRLLVNASFSLLGKPLSMGPLSVEHYLSVLHG